MWTAEQEAKYRADEVSPPDRLAALRDIDAVVIKLYNIGASNFRKRADYLRVHGAELIKAIEPFVGKGE